MCHYLAYNVRLLFVSDFLYLNLTSLQSPFKVENINIFIRIEARINLNSDFFFYRSFDVRGRSFAKALLWSDQNSFGSRAYFVTVSRPAGLTVDNIHLDDEGVSSRYI